MRKLFVTAACLVALAACGQTTTPATTTTETPATTTAAPQTAAEATAQDTCGASQYRAMVGTNIAAATFPSDGNIRVVMPNQAVTQDFRAERLNVITDANGVITSLECY
ncbi:MAG: I78 family peptidase inhibitor [Alphaproteobacteria bacterium]|nr:I78 family peptidase inhibitor [Alphaproteobacteria bacterium]